MRHITRVGYHDGEASRVYVNFCPECQAVTLNLVHPHAYQCHECNAFYCSNGATLVELSEAEYCEVIEVEDVAVPQ